MIQTANIHLIPSSNTESTLVIDDASRKLFKCLPNEAAWGLQELYVTISDKIKKDDWYITYSGDNYGKRMIAKATEDLLYIINNSDFCEKIIATTNKSLDLKYDNDGSELCTFKSFPSIPDEYVEYFIRNYNKGKIINEINVQFINKVLQVDYKNDIFVNTPKQK